MSDRSRIPELLTGSDGDPRLEPRLPSGHVNEITGVFVILIVVVLIAAVGWTGRSQSWFRSNVTLRINLPAAGAAGIRQGSEVYFLGTLVGSVSDVIVDAAGHMEAEASIRRDFFRFVRVDSSAVVKKQFGVAGDSFFEITRGHGATLPEKNAAIVCNEQFQSQLEAAVDEVHGEAMLVLKQVSQGLEVWTALGSNAITTREKLDQLIGRADGIAAGLQQGKGAAGKLLTDAAMADELQALMDKANHSMEGIQVIVNQLQDAGGNLQIASARLPAISAAVGHEAADLPGLVLQTQSSMREIERLVEAMQHQWLWRKYVDWTNPPPLRPRPGGRPPAAPPLTSQPPPGTATD